jgi:sensor histidine kinase YesM
MVPTFTFQPLLENSVIHGLTPKIEGGSAKLTVTRQGEMLCIVVSDTGVGMSSDQLCELKSALKDNKQDKVGIGVGNIYRRIYAMYEDGSMDIDSTEGEGTKVTIMIPYHTEINV